MAFSYCPHCARALSAEQICSHCGKAPGDYHALPHHFPAGTILDRRYWVGRVLGEGGFGITYLGFDFKLERRVAIKEYFPTAMVSRSNGSTEVTCYTRDREQFEKGREQFLKEARTLARVDNIPEIVRVMDFFPANGTAYIVMELLEGETLKSRLKRTGPMAPDTLFAMLDSLLRALEKVHKTGLIHRDISPDNIMLLTDDDQIKLMDFGCARDSSSGMTMTVMLKPGFAPFEQYSGREQGPWTDIYALCATMYYCMTGKLPPNAVNRMDDDTLLPPSSLGISIQPRQEQALMNGLAVRPKDRWQDMSALRNALAVPAPVPPVYTPPVAPVAAPPVLETVSSEPPVPAFPLQTASESSQVPDLREQTQAKKAQEEWEQFCRERDSKFSVFQGFGSRKSSAPAPAPRPKEIPVQSTSLHQSEKAQQEWEQFCRDRDTKFTLFQTGSAKPKRSTNPLLSIKARRNGLWYAPSQGYSEKDKIFHTTLTRGLVSTITFLSSLDRAPTDAIPALDSDGNLVLIWTEVFSVYVASEGGVQAPPDSSYLFANMPGLKEICFNDSLHTGKVTSMASMFSGCRKLAQLDLRCFRTGWVTNMSSMFYNCVSLKELDISSFNTQSATHMDWMFRGCSSLSEPDLSHLRLSGVKSHQYFMDAGKTIQGRPWETLFTR